MFFEILQQRREGYGQLVQVMVHHRIRRDPPQRPFPLVHPAQQRIELGRRAGQVSRQPRQIRGNRIDVATGARAQQRVHPMLGSGTGRNIDSIATNLSRLTTHLTRTTAELDTLLSRMNKGEGTLGRIATDTMMYHDLHELSVSLTTLLKDLKEHPDKYMKPGLVRVRLF